jgi:hypothetical protein
MCIDSADCADNSRQIGIIDSLHAVAEVAIVSLFLVPAEPIGRLASSGLENLRESIWNGLDFPVNWVFRRILSGDALCQQGGSS